MPAEAGDEWERTGKEGYRKMKKAIPSSRHVSIVCQKSDVINKQTNK